MRRREFIALFASTAAWPFSVAAQAPAKIHRVGYIIGSSVSSAPHLLEAFRQGLKELGYVEGQTIELEVRAAEGRSERMPELVAELIRANVDVMVVANSAAALAAKRATRTTPIVMFAGDPVALGLVASLARPEGNLTGLSYFNAELSGKRLQLLKELLPGLSRVAVLWNREFAMHEIFLRDTETAARKLGIKVQAIEVHRPEDFESAFAAATRGKVGALLALDDPLTIGHRTQIVTLAAGNRLPAIYGFREFPDDGGLMSYGPNFVALFRRAAFFVDKILKGAKPADLPVEQPTKFELVINLKTAKALGVTVPPTLLARADEVIE